MGEVYIAAVGQVPVAKRAGTLGRQLGAEAIGAALAGVPGLTPTALYVGNMMSGILSDQQQLGALVADAAGLRGVEAITAEAACASGAAALRVGFMAVASGLHRVALVCGLEKMTHAPRDRTTAALATASDWVREGGCGESFISLNARLMRAYMDAHGATAEDFAPFSLVAHDNARGNPNALFRDKAVDLDTYLGSRLLVPPVRLFDASPVCDGAAAVVLVDGEVARTLARSGAPLVRVAASAAATDSLALDDRASLLRLDAVIGSSRAAYAQAGLGPEDVDLFEVHDAYTIITVLSLEGAGFAAPGQGTRLGKDGTIRPGGDLPIATRGGLKARGHPVGATGVYQVVEAFEQLTGRAGANQLASPTIAMTQNVGGTGATVLTHLLIREA